MEIQALTRYARMSPKKVREVANEIQGRSVPEALDLVTLIPRKSARLLAKTLKSAVANAENNHNLSADDLFVVDAIANEGPTIKRYQPRAQGRAFPIHKPMTHITIVVADQEA